MKFGKKFFKGLAKFFDFLAEEEKKNDVVEEKELKVIEKKAAAEEKGKYNAWLIFKAAFLGALAVEIVKIIFTILESLVTLPSVMENPDFLQIIVNVLAGKADAVAEWELMVCRFMVAYGVIFSIITMTLIAVMISSLATSVT